MHREPKNRQLIALAMAAVMTFTSLPLGGLEAGMVSTQEIIERERAPADAVAANPRALVQTFLAREDVRAEMIALGISPAEAEARVAAMTDREIANLAGRLEALPAGGAGIGTILIFVFVAFGVTVLLDALGIFDIYPFVCGPGQCAPSTQAYYQEPAAAPQEAYRYDDQRGSYRDDPYDRRRYRGDQDRRVFDDRRAYDQRSYDERSYDPNTYYEPQPAPRTRNYFEERYGTQRHVR